jgi:adenylosuccinate lyase
MECSSLEAISPVDGRYRRATQKLADYFSESALIKYRVLVEVEYFIALCELPLPQLKRFDPKLFEPLRDIYKNFSLDDGQRVKDIEKTTNHDVKAVEYFLKEKFDQLGLQAFKEFIHFALTSQDINNTALPLSLKQAWTDVAAPILNDVIELLQTKARQWKGVALLARTHGQPRRPRVWERKSTFSWSA